MKKLSDEDLAEIEAAGRRCSLCRTGRRWRDFAVVRPAAGEPVVMCAACRVRYEDAPPARPAPKPVEAPSARGAEPPATPARAAEPTMTKSEQHAPHREDRVRRVLRELPKGEYSTGRVAKAAGLNHAKALRRLRELAEAGEIREVGKRWSTEPPPTDIDEALDRLRASTSNIRIVRDRSVVG